MQRTIALLGIAVVSLLGIGTAEPQAAPEPPRYTVTDLGTLGGLRSEAFALNERGEVAGWAEDAADTRRAFRWRAGRMTGLPVLPDFPASEGWGINEQGQVSGAATGGQRDVRNEDGKFIARVAVAPHAVLWSGPRALDLGPGGAYDVNNRGQVVGHLLGGHGFLWRAGDGRRELEPPTAGMLLQPRAINDAGQVAGTYAAPSRSNPEGVFPISPFRWQAGRVEIAEPERRGPPTVAGLGISPSGDVVGVGPTFDGVAFVWGKEALTLLGTMNGPAQVGVLGQHAGYHHSAAHGINDRQQVVGLANVSDSTQDLRAILWERGQPVDLNRRIDPASGWRLEAARAVNRRGQVCGVGQHDGRTRAFLLTPVEG